MKDYKSLCLFTLSLILVCWPALSAPLHAEDSTPKLAAGAGRFLFVDERGNADKPIPVWFYCPQHLTATSPIVFVMHGVNRDAQRYRNDWQDYAAQYNFLLLCPEFTAKDYPTQAYQWGNIRDAEKHPVPEAKWTFTAIEHLFDFVKDATKNTSQNYYIYGHSAGGQFVHRLVLFLPHARYARAIAANPGWYTMPTFTGHKFPYGLRDSNLTEGQLKDSFGRDFLLLLGDEDQDANDLELRKTPDAEEQGATRFERGQNYYKAAQTEATQLGTELHWHLATVPGAHHSDKQMALAAMQAFIQKEHTP